MHLSPVYPVTTERLRLRPLTEADVDALLAYRSIPEVCRYVPFNPMDRATVRERLADQWSRTQLTGEGQTLTLGVELAAGGHLIGDVILFLHSEQHLAGEIGWALNPDHHGHGYATEAAAALLTLAFEGLGLHRVAARVDARNDASLRVCERLGMRQEAHLRENRLFKGEWSDEIELAILGWEWRSSQSS